MSQYNNPTWWDKDYDSKWDRVKAAFSRDWRQTKHDFGGNQPNLNQNAKDTVKQASGSEPLPAYNASNDAIYRFGYGAREYYNDKYSEWDDDLEKQLRADWEDANPGRKQTWMQDRDAIRRGWDYYEFEGDEDEEEVTR